MTAVWLNGALVAPEEARVHVTDRGFALGDGLFETMRAYGRHLFRVDAHLARLAAGGRRIGLPLPGGLREALHATVAASGLDVASVRLTLTRGPGGAGLALPDPAAPTCAIVVRPYVPQERQYRLGVEAVVASGRLNEQAATAGLKQLGYLESVLAQREAVEAGVDDALRLDTGGHLAEGAASNLFLVRDGVLHTPPLSCGILPGITRAVVLELAGELGVETGELPLAAEALRGADEAFLTSSLREVVPLVRVGGRAVGTGRPGPLTLRLLAAYRDRVHQEGSEG